MIERIFARLGDDAALGADDEKWILYRPSRPRMADYGSVRDWRVDWRAIAFVRSHKRILARNLREKLGWPADRAAAALALLPDTFDEWKAGQAVK